MVGHPLAAGNRSDFRFHLAWPFHSNGKFQLLKIAHKQEEFQSPIPVFQKLLETNKKSIFLSLVI